MAGSELRHRHISDESITDTAPSAGSERAPSASKKAASFLNRQEMVLMIPTIACLILTVSCSYIIWRARNLHGPQFQADKLWTGEELAQYDGSNRYRPLVLSILGHVFDVSNGKKHYGKGNAYNHFCGRDATRAFVSGNFTGDGLTDDISGLPNESLLGLQGWLEFYQTEYVPAGKLIGGFFDNNGQPTKAFRRYKRQLKEAHEEKKREEEEEKRHPSCSSFWSSDEGGKVWCDKGYPRQVSKTLSVAGNPISFVAAGSEARVRCACYESEELGEGGLQVYSGCDPLATECKTSPPPEKKEV